MKSIEKQERKLKILQNIVELIEASSEIGMNYSSISIEKRNNFKNALEKSLIQCMLMQKENGMPENYAMKVYENANECLIGALTAATRLMSEENTQKQNMEIQTIWSNVLQLCEMFKIDTVEIEKENRMKMELVVGKSIVFNYETGMISTQIRARKRDGYKKLGDNETTYQILIELKKLGWATVKICDETLSMMKYSTTEKLDENIKNLLKELNKFGETIDMSYIKE